MRSRTLAALLAPTLVVGVVGGIGLQRMWTARSKPAGVSIDSCANLQPIRVGRILFNCDSIPSEAGTACEDSIEERARTRTLVETEIGGAREVWAQVLGSTRVVDRLESGDLQFTPELGQRLYDTMFAAVGFGSVPKSSPSHIKAQPLTERAFIESLKCLPHTWASIMLSSIPSLTDVDLRELRNRLPSNALLLKDDLAQRITAATSTP